MKKMSLSEIKKIRNAKAFADRELMKTNNIEFIAKKTASKYNLNIYEKDKVKKYLEFVCSNIPIG